MREAVEKVLGAEREARAKIELVKARVAELKSSIDKEAETRIAAAREQAAITLRDALDTARKESLCALENGQKTARELADRWYAEREGELSLWAGQVLDAVLKTELEKY